MSESISEKSEGETVSGLPLAGIKVLDLSRVLAGPWATMTLADLGAEVWKVENIGGGDDTRAWSVPSYKGVSTYYLCANRGKSSIAVNIKHAEGHEIIHRLAAKADVVIENFRPGTVQRLKIDYRTLKAFNPGIIYCSISGYGQTGPEWDRPGYDFVVQAESGLMSITGPVDGPPQRIGVAMTDVIAGMVAVQSVLAALYQRRETGQGQYVDISLLECAMNSLINVGSGYLNVGDAPRRYGNAHPTVVPYQICECSDGSFALAVGNDKQFALLCEKVIGKPELAKDPSYKTSAARALNRESLLTELARLFRSNTRDYWLDACLRHGVPAGEVKSVPEAFQSPTIRERGVVQTLHSQHIGPVALVRPAQGLKAQRDAVYKAPPMLGEDTAAVLSDVLGYGPEQVERLISQGVVRQFAPSVA